MKTIFVTLILITVLFTVNTYPLKSQTPEQLYQRGLMKEEGEGLLQDAINFYNQVADNSKADQSLRAKALLHIGICYEKLGTKEAVKAYQRLVSNFPTQKNEVAYARERLTRLTPITEKASDTPLTPKFTKIKIPSKITWAISLSPDGHNLGLVSDGRIWVMPLSGNLGINIPGKPVQVNIEGIKAEDTDLSWSRDGKLLAFNEPSIPGNQNQKIFIVPSSGGKPSEIAENYRGSPYVNYRISLSPDGKKLAFSSIENNKQHIYTISTEGGNPILLTDMQAREPAFSPDGKLIAYIEDKDLGRGVAGGGLWVVPASGGIPSLIAEGGSASSPIWSPDGNMIAFKDLSQGVKQINIVPVSRDGKNAGKVTKINAPEGIGGVFGPLAGWTPDNKLGALFGTTQEYNLYTLPSNGGQSTMVLNACLAWQPRWSHDGKQIFFTTIPQEGDSRFYRLFLASVPTLGGNPKPLPKNKEAEISFLTSHSGNRVSPDGNWIVSAAVTPADTTSSKFEFPRTKIWKIATDGSESIQITNSQGDYADLCPSWSPDGKKLVFVRTRLQSGMDPYGEYGMYIVNSSGGEPGLLTSLTTGKWVFSPVWSPDGKMIAYMTREKKRDNPDLLMNILNLNSRESIKVWKVPDIYVPTTELAWSPDSKEIAFNGKKIVHVMNIDDGSIKVINTNLPDNIDIWHLDWSPDGKQFVFAGGKSGTTEFVLIENFLPLEKLAGKKENEDMLIRKALPDTDIEPLGSPSPDGRYITFIDWNSGGNLGILDLETKERRLLTDFKDPNEQAYYSSWSPDGKQIAYFWWKSDKDQYNLSIVDVSKAESRDLFISDKYDWIELGNWSSDGKYIVATLSVRGKPESHIVRVSAADGSIQILKTFEKSYLGGKPWLSSDNRYVAFDLQDEKASGNCDIYLLSLENKDLNALIKNPSHDYILGWSPDGKNILYASDRTGTVDAMIIRIEGGKPVGQPKPVKQNIGPIVPLGFTRNGSFYYGQWPGSDNVYSAEIDIDKGKILVKPSILIQQFEGNNYAPDYSSDGKHIVYVSDRGVLHRGKPGSVLCIRDLETDDEQTIIPDTEMQRISLPQWSPDDNSIALTCYNKDGYSRIYIYNVLTRKFKSLIAEFPEALPAMEQAYPRWSRNGSTIYYLEMSRYSPTSRIMARNIETGIERELFRYTSDDFIDRIFTISVSPGGEWLAAINRGKNRVVRLISTNDGGTRNLYAFENSGGYPLVPIWSRDGKYIVFPYNEQINNGKRVWSLLRIPSEGGEPLSIEADIIRIDFPSLHPDGEQLCFSSVGYSFPENNIWEMKNFLPK